MSDKTLLGKLADETAQRDAIHVAIAPCIAGEMLRPGQGIAFEEGSTERVRAYGTTIGIVDPFLTGPVTKGQRFYMLLYPGTITSLRHEWTHPAFDRPPTDKDAAVEAIKAFGAQTGLSYDGVLEAAKDYLKTGYYIHNGQNENYKDADWNSMWDAYEAVTGTKVDASDRGWFFSCSC